MSTQPVLHRWPRRRVASMALRTMAALVPAAVALAVSWVMALVLPPGPSLGMRLLWMILTIALAIAAGALATRALRRTAPLAWLLKMDLAFPAEAPSRFATALRAGRATELAGDLREGRVSADDREASERIVTLAAALTAHDRATRGHSERVRGYTRLIGESMGIGAEDLDKLAWAGLLHDVGKLAIDPDILNKPSRLDADELVAMRRHPIEGARLAAPLMPWLGEWGQAIAHHHERWDGTGYPAGLSGRRISLGGRIVAVADAFEAMTAQRPYNTPRTLDDARKELVASTSTQFDPDVVRALLAVPLGRLSRLALPTAAIGVLPTLHDSALGLSESLRAAPVVLRNAGITVASTAVVATIALSPAPAGVESATVEEPVTEITEVASSDLGNLFDPLGVVSSVLPGDQGVAPPPPAGGPVLPGPAAPLDLTPPPPMIPRGSVASSGPATRPAADADGGQAVAPPIPETGGDQDAEEVPAPPPADDPGGPAAPPAAPPPPADPPPPPPAPPAGPGPLDPVLGGPVDDVTDALPVGGDAVDAAAGAVGDAVQDALGEILPPPPPPEPPAGPPGGAPGAVAEEVLDAVGGVLGGGGPSAGGIGGGGSGEGEED